jgi:hypothetical protein
MDRERIESEIERAFAQVPRPTDEDLCYVPGNWETLEHQKAFAGKHWRDVIDPEFLMRHRYVTLFSPQGMRFYLPAYLIGAIRYPTNSYEWLDDVVNVYLYAAGRYPVTDAVWPEEWRTTDIQRWDKLMSILTREEKHAVRCFFEYLLAVEPRKWEIADPPGNLLQLALANYWNQF